MTSDLMQQQNGSSGSVWVVRAGKGGRLADDFQKLGVVTIGFSPVGDVSGKSREEIFQYVKSLETRNPGNVAGMIDRFANVMQEGDVVVTPDGESRELLYGLIAGPYRFSPKPEVADHDHVRPVNWLGRRSRDGLPDRILYSLGSLLTVFQPAGADELREFLLKGVAVEGSDADRDRLGSDAADSDAGSVDASEQEARNLELIRDRIADLEAYRTQDLVAAILRSMGYETEVAPPGADGGVDIRACRDPLFLQPPVVKVQVKARPDSKTGPGDIRALIGVLDQDERGLFVSTGGFTSAALSEGEHHPRMTLIGIEKLAELLITNYDRLDPDAQRLVPLRRIWVMDTFSLAGPPVL